jgi:hypothetical protein
LRLHHTDHNTTLFLNIVGLLLCIAWALMTWVGRTWFYKSLRAGASVQIDPIKNPFVELQLSNPTRRRDPIFMAAMLVACLFALMYLIGLWPDIERILRALLCDK